MSDPCVPTPEPSAQPSSISDRETTVEDGEGELRPLAASRQLLADALVAALDSDGLPRRLAVFVAAATSAEQVLLWLSDDPDGVQLGTPAVLAPSDLNAARERAKRVLEQGKALREELPGTLTITLPLGLEPFGVLEARFNEQAQTGEGELEALQTLAARVAGVLEESAQRRDLVQELGRKQALLSFSGQAMSELAVEPTLNVAVEQIADLLKLR